MVRPMVKTMLCGLPAAFVAAAWFENAWILFLYGAAIVPVAYARLPARAPPRRQKRREPPKPAAVETDDFDEYRNGNWQDGKGANCDGICEAVRSKNYRKERDARYCPVCRVYVRVNTESCPCCSAGLRPLRDANI